MQGLIAAGAMLAVGSVAAAPAQGSPAAGAPLVGAAPAASSTVELAPDGADVTDVVVGDDALYLVSTNDSTADIHRRSLTAIPGGGTYVGEATLVGQTLPWNVVAEHEGTIAYARASDGALVLEDAAGNETVPAWGGSGRFAQGVTDLSDEWVVGRDSSGWVRLWDRQTGTEVPLGELAGLPDEFPYDKVGDAFVTDTRVVWSMDTFAGGDRFSGVYTVALDGSGASGSVTTIDTGVQADDGSGVHLYARGIEGAQITWVRSDCSASSCDAAVRWFASAPYTGTPGELDVTGRYLRQMTGTTLSLVTFVPSVVVEWLSLAGDEPTFLYSADLPGMPRGMDERLVAYADGADGWLLSDVTGATLTDVPPPAISFTDVPPGHPFYADIMWLATSGVTSGYPDGTFRPGSSVNRDAMAAFLYRLEHGGADAPDCTTAVFADVPASHPFCGEIAWLATTGVTTGWPDGTFRPSQPVTREAMAAFVYRFAHGPGRAPACTTAPFSDVTTGHPFCGEIAWMAAEGISTGWPDGTFRPGLTVERQAMAAFLHRFAAGA